MTIALTVLHVLVSLFLILVILLQAGKGGGMGTAFGGSAGGTQLLGAGGASTLLGKLTAGCAVTFMLTSLSLAYVASTTHSVINLQGDEIHEGLVPEPGAGESGEGAGAGAGTPGESAPIEAPKPIEAPAPVVIPTPVEAPKGDAAPPADAVPAPTGDAPAPVPAPAGDAPAPAGGDKAPGAP